MRRNLKNFNFIKNRYRTISSNLNETNSFKLDPISLNLKEINSYNLNNYDKLSNYKYVIIPRNINIEKKYILIKNDNVIVDNKFNDASKLLNNKKINDNKFNDASKLLNNKKINDNFELQCNYNELIKNTNFFIIVTSFCISFISIKICFDIFKY